MQKRIEPNTAILCAAFLLSRLVYHILGVRFDSSGLPGLYQFVDPELLRDRFLQSIFYLHGQPPLFNLVVGLVLKLVPGHESIAFAIIWGLLGALLALSTYRLMIRLAVQPRIALALALVFTIGPQCILYENWLFYTYPVAAMMSLSALLLHRFLTNRRTLDGTIFFSLLAAIILTRSLFHLAWFVAIVAMLAIALRAERRRVLAAAFLPLLIVLALYVKNAVVVGSFSSSTWLGMNLARTTTFLLPEDLRRAAVERGELSPLALIGPFSGLSAYRAVPHDRPATGIPVLDQEVKSSGAINVNNIQYVSLARLYLADALTVIARHPAVYLGGCARAYFTYFLPASNYHYLNSNRERIAAFERAYNLMLCGQILPFEAGMQDQGGEGYLVDRLLARGWLLVLGIPLLLLYGIRRLRRAFRDDGRSSPFALTLTFILMNIAYVTLLGNAVELGENNRFRFTIDAYFLVIAGLLATELWRRRQAARSASTHELTQSLRR